jgi:hypothetical protein
MTAQRSEALFGESTHIPAEGEVAVGSLELASAIRTFRDFADYCWQDGIDINSVISMHKSVLTEEAHGFGMEYALADVTEGYGKLIPSPTLNEQRNEYYRFHTMGSPGQYRRDSESQARATQLRQFRQEHIELALSHQAEYPQISQLGRLFTGAHLARNPTVFAAAADLLTCYGMTLRKIGRQKLGDYVLRLPVVSLAKDSEKPTTT